MSNDLGELFDRDPLKLSAQDLDAIIKRMREAQAQHELGVKPAAAERPKKPSKSENLLKDLGLG